MTRETIGHVEFTREGERLSLRYARSFARKAGWQMLALLLVGAGLLPWQAWKAAHSASLNWSRRELCCVFLPFIGTILTIIAVVCLAHLVFRRHRALVFDRGAGTCSLPRWFARPLVLPLNQIEGLLVTVRRRRGRRSVSVTKTTRLVLRGCPRRYQRLWGWVGLPADAGVEPVAKAMAAFLGCPCATVEAVAVRGFDPIMDAVVDLTKARHPELRQKFEEREQRAWRTEPAAPPATGGSETAAAAVPYGIGHRPMPVGDDLDRLLPLHVGAFARFELRRPKQIRRDPIYAQYRKDKAEVFVELGICDDARGAQEALATAKAETKVEPDQVIQLCSEGTEPSYLETVSPTLGAFLAWTRGGYYFSAHAKGGEGDLDSFVREFPY